MATTRKSAVKKDNLKDTFGEDFADLYIKINTRKISKDAQFRKIHSRIYDCDEYVWQGNIPANAKIKFVHADGRELPNAMVYNQISGPGVTLSGGEACMSLKFSKALVCPVEGVDLVYNFIDSESTLQYTGKAKKRTLFIRIYDNNSGVDNDRWLVISME